MSRVVPFRIPEEWSAAWFRQIYAEELAPMATTGGVTSADLTYAIGTHNADASAHPGLASSAAPDVALMYFVGG